jgi:dolichyl-phosphate-mannose-protein mannosyltransferase
MSTAAADLAKDPGRSGNTVNRATVPAARPESSLLVPGLLFLGALFLFAFRIWWPWHYIYDEVYHAYTAGQYVAGNHDAYVWYTKSPRAGVAYMWNHPPAGLLLIAAGIRAFGDEPFGWRIADAIFGAIGVVVAWKIVLEMTGRRSAALLTAIFLLADSLYFVQSRTSMLDIFGVVYMTAAFGCFYRFLRAPADRVAAPLFAMGAFMGLGIATKWNAVYASVLLGLVALIRAARTIAAARRGDPVARAGVRPHVAGVLAGLVLLPLAIYLAAYIPFFLTGHSFGQWFELQKQIEWYHSHLKETHPYQSPWWEWPLTLRPVWYSVDYVRGRMAQVYANGNLFLYALFVPAVLATLASWRKRDRAAALVLAIGFFGQWLPWMLVPRIAFVYHFLPAAIFGCIAVAWQTSELLRRRGWPRAVALGYVALVIANFAYFYPIRASVPLSARAVQQRMWLPRWR